MTYPNGKLVPGCERKHKDKISRFTHQAIPWKNSPTRKIASVGAKNGKKTKAAIAINPGKIVQR